jgi:hypothetical protein
MEKPDAAAPSLGGKLEPGEHIDRNEVGVR